MAEGEDVISLAEFRARAQEEKKRQKLKELLDFYFSPNRFDGKLEYEKVFWAEAIREIFQSRKNFQPQFDQFARETRAWLDSQPQFVAGAKKTIIDDLLQVIRDYKDYLADIIIAEIRENKVGGSIEAISLDEPTKND